MAFKDWKKVMKKKATEWQTDGKQLLVASSKDGKYKIWISKGIFSVNGKKRKGWTCWGESYDDTYDLKTFKSKPEALRFANKYMKTHSYGEFVSMGKKDSGYFSIYFKTKEGKKEEEIFGGSRVHESKDEIRKQFKKNYPSAHIIKIEAI